MPGYPNLSKFTFLVIFLAYFCDTKGKSSPPSGSKFVVDWILDTKNTSDPANPYDYFTVPEDQRWGDWFLYVTDMGNLTADYASWFNRIGFDPTPFLNTEGVWIANFTKFPPVLDIHPIIKSPRMMANPGYDIPVRCYIHGNAEIWQDGVKVFPPQGEEYGQVSQEGWVLYNTSISYKREVEFQLVTRGEGDFILLDRIDILYQW